MRKSVWVIDDDRIYQMIIKKLIRRSEVFENQHYFESAIDVLNQLETSQVVLPEVILLDINMPLMDGWQFVDRLKELFPNLSTKTHIFIVSSSIAYSDKERAEEFPEISAFLSKPISIEKIKEVGDFLNNKTRCRDQA